MSVPIRGIFVPHIVPLDSAGRLHEAELRRYLEWLIQKGVHGLYPNGSTGEFTRFTAEERRRIVQIACEVARGRVEAAKPLHFQLISVFDALISASNFPAGFRAGVDLRGFDAGISPQPGCIASESAKAAIAFEVNLALRALNCH